MLEVERGHFALHLHGLRVLLTLQQGALLSFGTGKGGLLLSNRAGRLNVSLRPHLGQLHVSHRLLLRQFLLGLRLLLRHLELGLGLQHRRVRLRLLRLALLLGRVGQERVGGLEVEALLEIPLQIGVDVVQRHQRAAHAALHPDDFLHGRQTGLHTHLFGLFARRAGADFDDHIGAVAPARRVNVNPLATQSNRCGLRRVLAKQFVQDQEDVLNPRMSEDRGDQANALLRLRHKRQSAPCGVVQRIRVQALSIADNARPLLAHRGEMLDSRERVERKPARGQRYDGVVALSSHRHVRLVAEKVGDRPIVRLVHVDIHSLVQGEIAAVERHAGQDGVDLLDFDQAVGD